MAEAVRRTIKRSEKAYCLEKLRILVAMQKVELRILAIPRKRTTPMPEMYSWPLGMMAKRGSRLIQMKKSSMLATNS